MKELASLKLNLARLKCLALLLSSLLRHRTVNLTGLATGNHSGTTNESCYRRFQRFFLQSDLNIEAVGRPILRKIPCPQRGWVLAMDRTYWKYGKRHVDILTIGAVSGKVTIPIAWQVFPQTTKRGNSNTAHRIKILTRVLRLMKAEDIHVLAMDREFGGRKWLAWLEQQGVGYVVRIKADTVVGRKLASEHRSTRKGCKSTSPQMVWGLEVFFASKAITSKGRRDERLHLISNRFHGTEALEIYKLRWGLELLFSHLKKRSFNLESTHMTGAAKLEKLLALVTLAFLFSYAWGCHLRATRKVTKAIARKSIFRQGLEDILHLRNNSHLKATVRNDFAAWLKSPFYPSTFVV